MRNKIIVFIILGFLGFTACKKTDSISTVVVPADDKPVNYDYPNTVYDFSKNPITNDGFLLGKKLFYDGDLSRDGTISCAECHNQSFAFTHHGHALSHGIDNQIGIRNTPTLSNLAYQTSFGLDGGVFDLDFFAIAPITNPVEMDQDMAVLIAKLNHNKDYPALFKKAFGSSDITTATFLKALSQFMLSLESKNARYDQYVAGKITFNSDEKAGLKLFESKGCISCHKPPLFTDYSFKSNGLDTSYFRGFVDIGRARITEKASDKFKFKVPSLRNLVQTYPYMHDGRFATIEDVLKHYASGMKSNANLDPIFTKNNTIGIPMTDDEQSKIVSFLKTLSDDEFLKNKKFMAE